MIQTAGAPNFVVPTEFTSTWAVTNESTSRRLFEQALDQPKPVREAFVRSVAPDNPWLVESVLELLRLDTEDSPLDKCLSRSPRRLPPTNTGTDIGDRIQGYRLLEQLGAGKTGKVFRAEGMRHGRRREVIIQVLRTAHLGDKNWLRFLQRQRAMTSLRHRRIAQLLDFGSLPSGREYLVLERVVGISVTEYANNHQLSIAERIELVLQVCDAIEFAHQRQVVHQDLKPTNMVVTSSGELRVIGFGGTATRSRSAPVTSSYASPEQLRRQAITPSTDIWALGILLFELLTGGRPFHWAGLSAEEVEYRLEADKVPKASASLPLPQMGGREIAHRRGLNLKCLRRCLRGELDRILGRALTLQPRHGYASVADLEKDLRGYLESSAMGARWRCFLSLLRG